MPEERQIMVRTVERPHSRKPQQELAWLCESFGIAPNDPRREILQEILKAERSDQGVRSVVISQKMNITRGGAVYHLNRMIETGLVVRNGRQYELRAQNLEETIEEMEEDMVRMFRRMRSIAKELDEEFGLQPAQREE